jgi:hypothetical protein
MKKASLMRIQAMSLKKYFSFAGTALVSSALTLGAPPAFAQNSNSSVSASQMALPLNAPPPPDVGNDSTRLEIATILRTQSIEDKVLNSKVAGGVVQFIGGRQFNSYLSGSLFFSTLLMTGSYTNRYTAEGAPPTGVELNNAYLDVHPMDWLSLQLGVLDLEFSSIVSSFNIQGFPGARTIVHNKGDLAEVSLSASQTVPTSPTPEVKSSEAGLNTTLNLATLSLATNPQDKADLTVKASATYFQFNNLTSSAATDSQYLGNTVSLVGSQARFMYGFQGNEYAGQASLRLTKKLKLNFSGSQLKNDLAPDSQNLAQVMRGSITYSQNGVNWTFGGGAFSNESDTLPASYTSARLGNNNRFGYMANILTEFEKQKTKIFASFVQANVIDGENKPYQADRQIISVGMEARYEIF